MWPTAYSSAFFLLWKQVVELHKQCRFLALYYLFYTMQNLYRFCDLHSNRPLAWTLIPQGLFWWGKKSIIFPCTPYKSIHLLTVNQYAFLQAAPKSLLWSFSLNTVIFRTQKASSSVHTMLGLLPLCCISSFLFISTFITACHSHPSYHGPNLHVTLFPFPRSLSALQRGVDADV